MKKPQIILLFIVIFSISIFFYNNSQDDKRSSYYLYDFANHPYLADFNAELSVSQQNQVATISDLKTIALQIAGYPNEDNTQPDEVTEHRPEENRLQIVVRDFNLMDDSLKNREVRVDFVQHQNTWLIEWAGSRWQCRRGLSFGWTNQFCT